MVTPRMFGDPASWPDDDLVALSREVSLDMIVTGYCEGVFPMPMAGGFGWYSPRERGVLPAGGLKVSRSLRKSAKHLDVTVDADFAGVLAGCADPHRPFGWIDEAITEAYTALHELGLVHSVEAWDGDGRLVGGLYGVSLGGLFAGESMFHDPEHGRDASKVALMHLVGVLGDDPGRVLDVQWKTDHLATLGVAELDRDAYLAGLDAALALPPPDWDAARARPPGAPWWRRESAGGG